MKKNLIVLLVTVFTFQFITLNASVPSNVVIKPAMEKKELVYFKDIKAKDVEIFLGRKMTFLEKVAFKVKKKSFVKILNEEEKKGTNGWAIAGFVCSLIIPPLGIIFSAISLGQIKKRGEKGYGLALAGLIIGIVFTILILV